MPMFVPVSTLPTPTLHVGTDLTNTVTGQPRSLEFRVQFHYNDHGQLKQISPWHDIPLYTPDGNIHMVVEIPKCAACPSMPAVPPPPHYPTLVPYLAGGRAPSSRSRRARSSIPSSRTPRTARRPWRSNPPAGPRASVRPATHAAGLRVGAGKLRDYNYGDMLFNYGCFPQTWEDPPPVERAAGPV